MLPSSLSFSTPTWISLSIITAVGVYVLFGPDMNDRKKRGHPTGLINYGNNCFANAIVQCLAASSIFIDWLNKNRHKNRLASILFDLIETINGDSSGDCDVARLINHMQQPRWLSPLEQQDSHEFLLELLNSLTTSNITRTKPIGFADGLESDDEESSNSSELHRSPLIMPHPFQGLQATQRQCTHCKHKNPISLSLFETLSLNIPERQTSPTMLLTARSNQRHFTLQELIGNYLKSEMISNLKCEQCHTDGRYPHRKLSTFSRLPEVLCFHIVRTTWTNEGWPVKNTSHVSFPDLLDMSPFIAFSRLLPMRFSPTQNSKKSPLAIYRLSSVLVHLGGISEAGHFIIYRRRTTNKGWLSISDNQVCECTDLQVFTSMAYILFYERVKRK